MNYRLALGVLVAGALLILIIRLGIMGGGSQENSLSSAPEAPFPALTNIPPPMPPQPTPNTGPLPSIDQPFRFWTAALRDGRLNTHQPAEGYIFKLAMNHRITVCAADGSVLGRIIVPGDVTGVDWQNVTTTQHARLTENGAPITLTPSMLHDLSERRIILLALSKVPPSSVPAERPYPQKNGLAETLGSIMTDRDLGEAFLCSDTPLYKYSLSTAPPGGSSWMNKKPDLIARAGTRVYKVAVFGDGGIIRNETRVKLVQSLSAPSYFVMSNWLRDACAP